MFASPTLSTLMTLRLPHARLPHTGRCVRRAIPVLLALAALLGLAQPAHADPPNIFGVQPNQPLTGKAILWAEARGPSHWMTLRLTGPGTQIEARGVNRRVHLLESAATGTPIAWDADQAQPGTYTLTATSFFRGQPWDVARTTFQVDNGNASEQQRLQQQLQEQARSQTQTAPPSNNLTQDQPQVVRNNEQQAQAQDQNQPQAQPANAAAPLPKARFPDDTPAMLVEGVGVDLPLNLVGSLPENGDILVLAWDNTRRQMVDAFAHEITQAPYRLDADHVAQLPRGSVELQLHVRDADRFVQTDTLEIDIQAPTASAPQALPDVSFARQSRNFTRGDGRGLHLNVIGALPQNGDLLAIGWSLGQGELVERFAHRMTTGPERGTWTIPASQLAKLPAGLNEVQVLVRTNSQVRKRIAITIRINEPVAANQPDAQPQDPELGQEQSQHQNPNNQANADNGNDTGSTPVVTLPDTSPTNPVSPPTTASGSDSTPTSAPAIVVTPDAQNVGFANGFPREYTRGASDVLNVALDGPLADDADVLLLAWSNTQRQMVSGFAHTLRQGDRRIKNGQLDKLPEGNVELQAHLRLPDGTIKVAKQTLAISVPNDEPIVEELPSIPQVAPIAAGAGFTSFPLKSGGRIVYVSSSAGSDANTGLSPNAPLKSPRAGYDMLRNGYPDQLLFKAGDTFRGGLGVFKKSGRNDNDMMIVGVYGSSNNHGGRAKFFTDGQGFVQTFDPVSHVAFVGIHAYANHRDPASGEYRSGSDFAKHERAVAWYAGGRNLHFEDCKFEYYKDNIIFQPPGHGDLQDVTLFRVISNNAWSPKDYGHAQGLYATRVWGMEIIESTFDHNGWLPGRTNDKTQFNHNIYMQKTTKRIHLRRVILSRGSHNGVQLRGGGILEDSLLAFNPYQVLIAQEPSTIRRNVIVHGVDVKPSYPLGISVQVLPCSNAVVEDNLIAHKHATAGHTPGIGVNYRNDIIDPPSAFNVTIQRNIIANYPVDRRERSIRRYTSDANVTERSNLLDYASGGDTDPPFVDPTRDLNRYAAHIGAGNHEGFVTAAVNRGRGAWEERYAAAGANRWIRAGFDFLPYD